MLVPYFTLSPICMLVMVVRLRLGEIDVEGEIIEILEKKN
jgi:hypothetical protein